MLDVALGCGRIRISPLCCGRATNEALTSVSTQAERSPSEQSVSEAGHALMIGRFGRLCEPLRRTHLPVPTSQESVYECVNGQHPLRQARQLLFGTHGPERRRNRSRGRVRLRYTLPPYRRRCRSNRARGDPSRVRTCPPRTRRQSCSTRGAPSAVDPVPLGCRCPRNHSPLASRCAWGGERLARTSVRSCRPRRLRRMSRCPAWSRRPLLMAQSRTLRLQCRRSMPGHTGQGRSCRS